MRISRKDAATLKEYEYHRDDHLIKSALDGHMHFYAYGSYSKLCVVKEALDSLIETCLVISSPKNVLQEDVKTECITSIQEVFDRVKAGVLDIYLDKRKNVIIFSGVGKEGIREYHLRKPEWYNKEELIGILKEVAGC
jgi:hypothetical protein